MPSRGNFRNTEMTQTVNGVTTVHGVISADGHVESISALNNAGSWKPGVWRANPVVITDKRATSSGGSSGSNMYYNYRGNISGHVHAAIANAVGWGAASSGYDGTSSYNPTIAAQSLQSALAKMNTADLDLGMMLAEIRETISGLRKPLSALQDYVKLYNRLRRQGRRPKMTDTLDMLTGSWLEWRYGITPLISDISAILEHLRAESLALQGKLLRKRGKVTPGTKKLKFKGSTAPGYYYLEGEVEVEITEKYVSSVFYRLERPLTFGETYGLDFASIPMLAWELMPLSFVWDWFFTVGNFLGALKVSDARTFVGCTTSQKVTVKATTSVTQVKFFGAVSASFSGGSYTVVYEKLDRRVNAPMAISPLVNRNLLSVKRQLDAISLLWQRMPHLRR